MDVSCSAKGVDGICAVDGHITRMSLFPAAFRSFYTESDGATSCCSLFISDLSRQKTLVMQLRIKVELNAYLRDTLGTNGSANPGEKRALFSNNRF